MKKSALLAGVAMLGLMAIGGQAQGAAFISNGVIALGVNDTGELNVGSTDVITAGSGAYPGASLGGVDPVGLRFLPPGGGGFASTEPGCICEGWGVAIKSAGVTGHANRDDGSPVNLTLVSFSATASKATSIVTIAGGSGSPVLQVTHEYAPSAASPNLYQVSVSIKNISADSISAGDLLYRRVMDWDVEPTPFNELVTIQGVPALLGVANGNNVNATSNDGFQVSDPLAAVVERAPNPGINTNFTDSGPEDHGAMFQFEFEALGAGETRSFAIFYGAAATEAEADAARAAAGIGLYSYGQCSASTGGGGGEEGLVSAAVAAAIDPLVCQTDSATTGAPVTFIFGFGARGGVLEPPPPPPPGTDVPVPGTLALLGAGLAGLGMARRRRQTA